MEIRKINELLQPFNIELICENCSHGNPENNKYQSNSLKKQLSLTKTEAFKDPQVEDTISAKTKTIKKFKISQKRLSANENWKSPIKNNDLGIKFSSPTNQRVNLFPIQKINFNPPKQLLNLNIMESFADRQKDISRLMEDSMRTPPKIGEVEIENQFQSNMKNMMSKKQFSNSTTDGIRFEFEELSQDGHMQVETDNYRRSRNELMALGDGYSRDTSPFQTPIKYKVETPISHLQKTPDSVLFVSPMRRDNGLVDGKKKTQSDFPMNLFYDSMHLF